MITVSFFSLLKRKIIEIDFLFTVVPLEQNRKRVKDAGLISLVVPWFDSQQKDLIRTLCGFYLNSSMGYGKNNL